MTGSGARPALSGVAEPRGGDGSFLARLASLNEQQTEAVRHFEGPLLVVAGAGSGKTRVLTTRIAYLIRERGVHPARIMAVTFTNKAAGEMRSRVVDLLGEEPRGMWIGTFHAIGARLLRRHAALLGWTSDFTIYDADEQLRLVKEILKRVPKGGLVKASAVRGRVGELKQELLSVKEHLRAESDLTPGPSPLDTVSHTVLPLYEGALKERNAFDFDDLLLWPLRLFDAEPEVLAEYRERFAFVLVDEYQDTSHPQFRFIDFIGRGHNNVMVVGDPDQAIYGWRGADVRNILDFERSWPGARKVVLERNYRSRERILQAANAVIRENIDRPEKNLRAARGGGIRVKLLQAYDDVAEAKWIARRIRDQALDDRLRTWRDFAVLYRTNAQARALESELILRKVPYQVVGGIRFYERREIQDVIAYLRLIANPSDVSAFSRAVGYPRRGVGVKSRARVVEWAAERGVSVLEAAARAQEIPFLGARPRLSLVRFAELVREHRRLAAGEDVSRLIQSLVDRVDMRGELRAEGPDGEDRARNVEELIAGAASFRVDDRDFEDGDPKLSVLAHFLQQVSLLADVDRHDSGDNSVSLMTLHNAKGLEFPVVFITGAEEGLLPLMRADDDFDQVEEERRLFYVGITRAEDELTVSWVRRRRRAGQYLDSTMSSFLLAIPSEDLRREKADSFGPASGYGGRSRYGAPGPGLFDRGPDGSGLRRGGVGRAGRSGRTGRRPGPFGSSGTSSSRRSPEPEDESQDAPRLVKGARVRHPTFGSGVVKALTGFGMNVTVEVEFDEVGRKLLDPRQAKLETDWP